MPLFLCYVTLPVSPQPARATTVVHPAEPVHLTADEALAPATPKARTQRDDAADWLLEYLATGEMESKKIEEAAEAEGINWRTLKRAKADLGVRAVKKADGPTVKWYWSLKEDKGA